MSNSQISILYNGHKTAVTCLQNNTYLVQITSAPFYVQNVTTAEGANQWIEVSTGMQTPLSIELGKLIEENLEQQNQ